MNRRTQRKIWIAVRIERGFVSAVKAFQDEEHAVKQEKSWRRLMNPDYDETGIAKVNIPNRGTAKPRVKAIAA